MHINKHKYANSKIQKEIRFVEKISKQGSLLHEGSQGNSRLTSMKDDAKARCSEVTDIVEYRESACWASSLWSYHESPLIHDSDNSGTGKIYHENCNLGKPEDFAVDDRFTWIRFHSLYTCASWHCLHWYSIKMDGSMERSSPILYMVQDTAWIQSFIHMFTLVSRGIDRPRYYLWQIHVEGSAESAKEQLDWQCSYKAKKGAMFSRDNIWTNAAKMGQEEWYEMALCMSGSFISRELALVDMRVLAQVISPPPVKVNGLPTGTFTPRWATGLLIFIPIERHWQQLLVTTRWRCSAQPELDHPVS